ncbi:glycosyltransferase [Brevibacillus laterosporus]|uniref:glycosyltransferase n=1 Tax=Brevibacillus laterosporus TaxID=1465 RepID=UPI000B9BBEB5|nr:glycosyltransferase [Brevibacillus laterosporus]MBG9790793.1 glycosyl transferase [Brevibacillus laterosporus]MCG7318479.1 glycosyltransferase [Brevibacillus laterosporus]
MHRVLLYRRIYLPRSETFIYEQLIGHTQVEPLVVTRSKPINVDQFPHQSIYVKKKFRNLHHWVKKKQIKVLHARFGTGGLELLPVAKRSKLPLLVSFHGTDVSRRPNVDPEYRRQLKKLFGRGSAFTVVSKHMKKKVIKLGCPKQKITLLRSGIDLQKFTYQAMEPVWNNAYGFLSVGRLVEKKGMDTLIRAFRYVHKVYPKATLTIVGEGDQKKKLEKLIKRYKLQNCVILKGGVSHLKVAEELARCHVFVLACKTAKDGNQEGIPNVLMEAMATGRPVISTSHAGIPELVEHGVSGLLAPEKSPRTFAEMMIRMIKEEQRWTEYTLNARVKVEKQHDIKKQRKLLENVYVRLIKENSRRIKTK